MVSDVFMSLFLMGVESNHHQHSTYRLCGQRPFTLPEKQGAAFTPRACLACGFAFAFTTTPRIEQLTHQQQLTALREPQHHHDQLTHDHDATHDHDPNSNPNGSPRNELPGWRDRPRKIVGVRLFNLSISAMF
jgi:hypothetical protein